MALVNQPTSKPLRKVQSIGYAGSLATVATFLAIKYLDMPADVAAAVGGIIATVTARVVAYYVREEAIQ